MPSGIHFSDCPENLIPDNFMLDSVSCLVSEMGNTAPKRNLPIHISEKYAVPCLMSPRKRVFFSFLLNKSLSKDQIRPEHLLHNTISPCAQTRRIKDIGLVLRKCYGSHRNTEGKEGIIYKIMLPARRHTNAQRFWYNNVIRSLHMHLLGTGLSAAQRTPQAGRSLPGVRPIL